MYMDFELRHHDHDHGHGHCHNHEHGHCHNHDHDHECQHHHDHDHQCGGGGCGHCQHEHSPMEELAALMKYMVGHNAAHAEELADLAQKLDDSGNHSAYRRIMDAVVNFDVGNATLAAVLEDLTAEDE